MDPSSLAPPGSRGIRAPLRRRPQHNKAVGSTAQGAEETEDPLPASACEVFYSPWVSRHLQHPPPRVR